MGYKLVRRDEVFYPTDYGLNVGDNINLVLVGGGGSTDALLTSASYVVMGYVPETPPTSTIFGKYFEALPGANAKSTAGAISGFADGASSLYSGTAASQRGGGGGGGWLPGVPIFGGSGQEAITAAATMLNGPRGLAGEGTNTGANVARQNRNPYSGTVEYNTAVINNHGYIGSPVGMARAEDTKKISNPNVGGGGAGAGFGAGAGGAITNAKALGGGAGAQILFENHTITAEDVANGIPIIIGRPGNTFGSTMFTSYLNATSNATSSAVNVETENMSSWFGNFGGNMIGEYACSGLSRCTYGQKSVARNGVELLELCTGSVSSPYVVYRPDFTKSKAYRLSVGVGQVTGVYYLGGYWVVVGSAGVAYAQDLTRGFTVTTGITTVSACAFMDGTWYFTTGSNTTMNLYATTDFKSFTAKTRPVWNSTVASDGNTWVNTNMVACAGYLYIFTSNNASNIGNMGVVRYNPAGAGSGSVIDSYSPSANNGAPTFCYTVVDDRVYLFMSIINGDNVYSFFAVRSYTATTANNHLNVSYVFGSVGWQYARAWFEYNPEDGYVYVTMNTTSYGANTGSYMLQHTGRFPLASILTYSNGSVNSIQAITGGMYTGKLFYECLMAAQGFLGFKDGRIYFSSPFALGSFSVAIDSLYATPVTPAGEVLLTLRINGLKDASATYQEERAGARYCFSGADGCCAIFW